MRLIESKWVIRIIVSVIVLFVANAFFCINSEWHNQLNAQNILSEILKTNGNSTDTLPREQWGAMIVEVFNRDGQWIIKGKKQEVIYDSSDFSITVNAGPVSWSMLPSQENDITVKTREKETLIKLIDAKKHEVEYYDAGYKTGIKIVLSEWNNMDIKLFMTLCLEGKDEDLVFHVSAEEGQTSIRQLNWPTALNPENVDHTLLSNWRGVLLPSDWPKPYHPIRTSESDGTITPTDRSEIVSNVIESWSMSWWGFQKGNSAMMVIIESPNDAAYQFSHPAGGPTIIGPRWRASLGKFRYPRYGRFCFIEKGNYVNMAKRYRKYAMDMGLFVSLKDKINSRPIVGELIGTPLIRSSILRNYKEGSARWVREPDNRYRLTTFDQKAEEFRDFKQNGIEKLHVVLTGWPELGYDRQHPEVLPVAPVAGGFDGMKKLAETCKELGYLFALHDQYRDFYVDAPSFDIQFAVHEEDDKGEPMMFPGTRFGSYKEGRIPYMDYWDGGKMTYLSGRFALGHLKKNYQGLFDHGIYPKGSYLDVFGYIAPDEDFNPQHPSTRTHAISDRIDCYNWAKNNLGLVGTEAACDWTVPHADYSSPLRIRDGIEVPLWDLVYHDAIFTTYNPRDLRGPLYGGMPQIGGTPDIDEDFLHELNRMVGFHKRVALLEMTDHEFLDDNYRRERTTFSDGSTVTVDWDKNSIDINPLLKF
jgi:hypothetical protein